MAFSTVDGTVLRKSGGTLTPVVGGFVEPLERQSAAVSRSPEEFKCVLRRADQGGRLHRLGRPAARVPFEGSELPVLTLSLTDQLVAPDPKGTPMTVVPWQTCRGQSASSVNPCTRGGTFTDIDNANAVREKFALKTGDHVSSARERYRGRRVRRVRRHRCRGLSSTTRRRSIAVDTNTCEVVWQIESPAPT